MAAWILGIIAVVAAGIFLMKSPSDFEKKPGIRPNIEGAYVKGNADAKVVLEEFSDFQCPACAAFSGVVKEIEKTYGDKIAIVYRHYPLKSIHQNAEKAAFASEAAGMQNKFWEMHDKLFETQSVWANELDPSGSFEKYAQEISLDLEKFKTDINSEEVKKRVEENLATATQKGLRSTPSFLVNSELVKGLNGPAPIIEAIENALNEQN